jgi:hypothetical protein
MVVFAKNVESPVITHAYGNTEEKIMLWEDARSAWGNVFVLRNSEEFRWRRQKGQEPGYRNTQSRMAYRRLTRERESPSGTH